MPRMLEALLAESKKEGWAVGSGSMEQVLLQARTLGMTEVPTRRGDPTVTTLRPVDGRMLTSIRLAQNTARATSRFIAMALT